MPDPILPHLRVDGFSEAFDFKSPSSAPRRPAAPRDRAAHGRKLIRQLQNLERTIPNTQAERVAAGLEGQSGITVALEIQPIGALDFQSVEWKRDGIEVLNVQQEAEAETVILHIPDGKLTALVQRIQAYLNVDTSRGKPKHMALVNAIEQIRNAVFDDLWTDLAPPPEGGDSLWFQVWLRATREHAKDVVERFREAAAKLEIEVESGHVSFPGRVVVAVRATRDSIQKAAVLLDMVAEIRGVSPTAEFFLSELAPHQQEAWIHDLVKRSNPLEGIEQNRVTLLDTGVNAGHPLLRVGLPRANMHAYDPAWLVDDRDGHGTEMAGLCLYGNLVPTLAHDDPVDISHHLESVKIFPDDGDNAPHLYGHIISQATSRVEVSAPAARRVFVMMTTSIGDIGGEPSEWSATIDQLAFGRPAIEVGIGADEDEDKRTQRLYVLAGGNVQWSEWHQYPDVNHVRTAEDPSQAWNALTVGATTNLIDVDAQKHPGLRVIAPLGGLAPATRTSVLWKSKWPFKPDVLAEGGNGTVDAGNNVTVGPESLRQLTTAADMRRGPLCETGDTSAATAEVARLCARLAWQYPDYWPETIRALAVQGARHTTQMRSMLPVQPSQLAKRNFLRTFGHGLINEQLSLSSDVNRPTMVIQQEMQPLQREDGNIKFGQVVFHELPWPAEELLPLAESEISLRITLSYFVEPNPSKRGWQSKFRYQSYGLRFALKGATETDQEFAERVNALERDEDDEESHGDPDRAGWSYGHQLRTKGSLHSDVWTGSAAELAAKGTIAVFPVGGWWKDWKDARQWNTSVRYSLVLTLEAPEDIGVDLYTPIKNQIEVVQEIAIPR